jgi:glycosyltransferase involved in cell wall biosynthesis
MVLGLFFTRGVSLRQWLDSGLFDREVLIYQEHLDLGYFSKIYWFTYGANDSSVAIELYNSGRLSKKIEVIGCPRWFNFFSCAKNALYLILMPIFIKRAARECDVFKTNQMDGSLSALICSLVFRRPIYVRTGYTLSRALEKKSPSNFLKRGLVYINEFFAFKFSSAASVTSKYDRDFIVKNYGRDIGHKIIILRNYVDTNLFVRVVTNRKSIDRILYVGRLSPEKNLVNAILACQRVGLRFDIVGAGADSQMLSNVVKSCGANVSFLGAMPNKSLPNLFKDYRYFILPSLWEGLPKALIEAMSAGLVCIGNNTTGINEIIEDNVTGYLSISSEVQDLTNALERALAGDFLRVSQAAREYVRNEFSLQMIADQERVIFENILSKSL